MDVPTLAELRHVDRLLPRFERAVARLRADDYVEINVPLLLIDRDLLADQFDRLNERQRARLTEADRQLAAKHGIVAQMLPTPIKHPRARWWWFLHEGPQVRAAAEGMEQHA